MKAPFFLLGFLSMLITVSAFAAKKVEMVPYDQKIKSLAVGMWITFPSGTRLEPNGISHATKTYKYGSRTCRLSYLSDTPVRLETVRIWTVENVETDYYNVTVRLAAKVEGVKRDMELVCDSDATNDVLRNEGVDVPREKPVVIEVIRDDGSENYDHVRDPNSTIAI